MSLFRDSSLYHGLSDRSRGWKSKKVDSMAMEGHTTNPRVVRWDGAARTCRTWDHLRRDPELWYRDGDCFVHLYEQGQSRRGPAFKVPLAGILEASCYPLVERYIHDNTNTPTSKLVENAGLGPRRVPSRRVDLYIPAPPKSDKQQSYQYHLATRNFFAWIFRRSMVGEYLGPALVALLKSMEDLRAPGVDNVADLLSYMDEEGYLDCRNQPSHALAVLQLADVCQLRDLYVDAFAHCCGMGDRLPLNREYQLLSSMTKKLMRRARIDMDLKLDHCGLMLRSFLQDELSESHLGLHPGARAHLERFRALLMGLYTVKFGQYPPPATDMGTNIFDVDVLQTMRTDFESLYEYLVDKKFDPSQSIPTPAQGGICVLQTVQAFDARHKFTTLDHPMPLLPELALSPGAKRLSSWLAPLKPLEDLLKLGPGQRAAAHVAVLKATNKKHPGLLDNDLVRAYRRFEEDSIRDPLKADRHENIGLVDARKIRWILVYGVYQVLLQATRRPVEVRDAEGVPYHLCISTANIPPWRVSSVLARGQAEEDSVMRSLSTSTAGWSGTTYVHTPPTTPTPACSVKLEPDIDYLAARPQDEAALHHHHHYHNSNSNNSNNNINNINNSNNINKTLRRRTSMAGNSVRRSLSLFGLADKPARVRRRPSQYHEILVHGYGNGTNNVVVVEAAPPPVRHDLVLDKDQDKDKDENSNNDDDDDDDAAVEKAHTISAPLVGDAESEPNPESESGTTSRSSSTATKASVATAASSLASVSSSAWDKDKDKDSDEEAARRPESVDMLRPRPTPRPMPTAKRSLSMSMYEITSTPPRPRGPRHPPPRHGPSSSSSGVVALPPAGHVWHQQQLLQQWEVAGSAGSRGHGMGMGSMGSIEGVMGMELGTGVEMGLERPGNRRSSSLWTPQDRDRRSAYRKSLEPLPLNIRKVSGGGGGGGGGVEDGGV